MKSGNLNFLETCGPLQACNGTALPLPDVYLYLHSLKRYLGMVFVHTRSLYLIYLPTNTLK
jgi:hypothetical protein